MSHDTLLHRLVRPSACALAATRVRPNHLTALRIVTGIGAATCFAAGRPAELRLGAVMFVLSVLLDRADGELARQSGRFSQFGHWLDLASDCSCDALVFIGLAFSVWNGALGNLAPLLGALAGLSTVLLFWQIHLPDERASPDLPRNAGSRTRRVFDADDLMLGVPLIVCTAGPNVTLLLAGILTPLALLGVVVARRLPSRLGAGRRRRTARPSPPWRSGAIEPVGRKRTMPHG